MKIKNKGKVHPSPSSSSSYSNDMDVFSVLKVLPATILAMASILSLEDREVLAYMITRSLKTSSATSLSSLVQESNKKSSKKAPASTNSKTHKPPLFDCECFDCYTSYWFRWDSSPNRELIHQVIEAFEDHLTNGEKSKKNGGRGKRREKMVRQETPKLVNDNQAQPNVPLPNNASQEPEVLDIQASNAKVFSLENDVLPVALPEISEGFETNDKRDKKKAEEAIEEHSVVRTAEMSNHKGLARKALSDVLGILNSRLWSLWSPNV